MKKGETMKDKIFERELKVLINYVRSYGIEHMSQKYNMKMYMEKKEIQKEFTYNVHKGFYLAQRNCILLLKKVLNEKKQCKLDLKEARKDKDKEKCKKIDYLSKKASYQELVLRKIMDAIAWQLFDKDLSILRRLYHGQEVIDITDSNIDSEIRFIEKKLQEDRESFVLISDLTSFIQVGDVVIRSQKQGLTIMELKEGKTNAKIYDLIKETKDNPCPQYLWQKLDGEDMKFQQQFKRDIKQMARATEVMKIIHEGEGKDLYTGINVKRIDEEIVLGTYTSVLEGLLKQCNKKNYAISVVEDCLLVGVYQNDKFSSEAFDVWVKGLNIRMPIFDLRYSIFAPLDFPIFLLPFSDNDIIDIIMGRKTIKMTIDIDKWLESFKQDGYSYRWMPKKETARINSTYKGKKQLFTIDGCGVELIDSEGDKQQLGYGIFSRMFTSLNTPSSLRRYLVESYRKIKNV